MKKIVVIISFLTVIVSQSQIKVKKLEQKELIGMVGKPKNFTAKLFKDSSDYITFLYQDQRYKQITELKSFYFRKSDLKEVYNLFSNYSEEEVKTVELENGDTLIFSYFKVVGQRHIVVGHTSKGVTGKLPELNKRKLNKLFGIK